ncbi:MAG: septal ring lytic transglycosylase RlpA family protein [Burkholderiaceae bacterium]|nr:septal ring lytic transglycosylase RlpA family protein [Burkholderiaceae bacterium]
MLALAACGSLWTSPTGPAAPATPEVRPVVAAPAPPSAPKPATPAAPAAPERVLPRVHRLASGPPNHPYEIKGEAYVPDDTDVPVREVGLASWYGHPFHGRRTASGEVYDMNRLTAAHKTMPLPSYARVRNLANGREIIVKVNDRGPFYPGRVIDLSRAAARQLRITGLARVEVERITHDEIRTGAWRDRTPGSAQAAARGNVKAQVRSARQSSGTRVADAR